MKSREMRRALAEITAAQWGMVTTAQAQNVGVSRLTLSRLEGAGHFERLEHGVYRDAAVPSDEFEDLRAAWLSTEPKRYAEERLHDKAEGVIVASASSALIHGMGDLWAQRHEFITAKRRQTQRPGLRYRQRRLGPQDITVVQGLPALTRERTVADLLEDIGDMSLVAHALSSSLKAGQSLDLERLRQLLTPLAERYGFKRHDGGALLDHLLRLEDMDVESIVKRMTPVLDRSHTVLELSPAMIADEMVWHVVKELPASKLSAGAPEEGAVER